MNKPIKYCFVPGCGSNSVNCENIFVSVPTEENRRRLWFAAVERTLPVKKYPMFCCQDHFNLEEDAIDFKKYVAHGGYLRIKPDILPRKIVLRYPKLDALTESPKANALPPDPNSNAEMRDPEMKPIPQSSVDFSPEELNYAESIDPVVPYSHSNTPDSSKSYLYREKPCRTEAISSLNSLPDSIGNFNNASKPSFNISPSISLPRNEFDASPPLSPCKASGPSKRAVKNVKTQVSMKKNIHFRSVGTGCNIAPKTKSTGTQTEDPEALEGMKTQWTEAERNEKEIEMDDSIPAKKMKFNDILSLYSSDGDGDNEEDNDDDNIADPNFQPSEDELENLEDMEENDKNRLAFIVELIEKHPMMYIGVPKEWLFLIEHLTSITKLNKIYIFVTLMKIRLNDSHRRLSHQFRLSLSKISRIYNETVPILAFHLKTLIFWPEKKSLLLNLPIAFRYAYKEVESIIDCFEIEIEKPSKPINQALTWSDYKKANTIKYLISSTPDGLINYISKGYGGRATDVLIVEKCGYLDVLPNRKKVMADRGFKQIDMLLQKKNCTLIRPPSVFESVKPTKNEVIEAKRIAAVRIHIERAIRRLREFDLLLPHSVINCQMVSSMDDIVTIAAALCNLQNLLIAT